MRGLVFFTLVLAGLVGPGAAHASCLSIPDGTGSAAVHCSDGTVGRLRLESGGLVTGMIGAQSVLATPEAIGAPSLASASPVPAPLNPDALPKPKPPPRAPPSLAPPTVGPALKPVEASGPFP